MGIDKSNEWCVSYVSSFCLDFMTNLIQVFISLSLYNWSLKSDGCFSTCIRKIFGGRIEITSFFTKRN